MKKFTNNGFWGKITIILNLAIFVAFILTMVFLMNLDKVNVELTKLEPTYIEQTNTVNEIEQPYKRINTNIDYYSAKLDSLNKLEIPKNRKEANALKDEKARIASELEVHQKEKSTLDSTVAAFKADYDVLKNEYDALNQQTESKKSVYDLLCMITLILVIVKIVMFAAWNFRNSYNLHAAAKWMKDGHKPYWAWLGWIIPVYNLIKPFSFFNEIWEETDYILKDKALLDKDANKDSDFFLELWWGFFLISVLLCLYMIHSTFFTSGAMFWKFSHVAVAVFAIVMWAVYLLLESIIIKKYIGMNNILCANENAFAE